MRSDRWILEIEGKRYAVDRTFSNDPAIYQAMEGERFTHITESDRKGNPATSILAGLKPEEKHVIIIARVIE